MQYATRCVRSAPRMRAATGGSRSSSKMARPRSRPGSRRSWARPAAVFTRAGHGTTRCSRRCASICATPSRTWRRAPKALHRRSTVCRRARARSRCRAIRTCSRRCRAAWRSGRAGMRRKSATMHEGLRHTMRRIGKNPLGSAAGYGTPNLDIDREITRAALGFAEIHEPVTAVQLSRGKAEAGVLFEIALLMQDLGRLASDVLLFYTREFGFVTLPEAYTTGSSIMPQKRNPDVFELVRGRSATAQACLAEVLGDHDQAAIWVSTRPAAHQGAALPRDRPVPGVSRRDGGCDRGTALCTGAYSPRRGHRRCGRSKCAGRGRGDPFPRSISACRNQATLMRRRIVRGASAYRPTDATNNCLEKIELTFTAAQDILRACRSPA